MSDDCDSQALDRAKWQRVTFIRTKLWAVSTTKSALPRQSEPPCLGWKDGKLGPPAQVVLNFAVGGNWTGRHGIAASVFPQALKIDYVRVCQYTTESSGDRLCGSSQFAPDPDCFSCMSELRDTVKPTFLRVDAGSKQGNGRLGIVHMPKDTAQVEASASLSVPEDHPADRKLRILLYNEEGRQNPFRFNTR